MKVSNEILVVDDNNADVKILRDFWPAELGAYHFVVAEDGEQALNYIHKRGRYSGRTAPCIVFLDLNLPRKSGTEVLTEIKKHPEFKNVTVIVLSGSDDPRDKAQCLALGAERFFTKPSNLEGLGAFFSVMKSYLRKDCGNESAGEIGGDKE